MRRRSARPQSRPRTSSERSLGSLWPLGSARTPPRRLWAVPGPVATLPLSVYVPPFRFALRVASTPQARLAVCYPVLCSHSRSSCRLSGSSRSARLSSAHGTRSGTAIRTDLNMNKVAIAHVVHVRRASTITGTRGERRGENTSDDETEPRRREQGRPGDGGVGADGIGRRGNVERREEARGSRHEEGGDLNRLWRPTRRHRRRRAGRWGGGADAQGETREGAGLCGDISRRMYKEIKSSRDPRDHVEDG